MYFHGYHLEHLCGLRKSRSERQKVIARITVVVQVKYLRNWTYNIIILKFENLTVVLSFIVGY
jgi:intergrase/recombinase